MSDTTINNEVLKKLTVQCVDRDDMYRMRECIYKQLAGNKDYVNNNIVLNASDDIQEENECNVYVWFFKGCEEPLPCILV